MVLVDTSIWISFLRKDETELKELLLDNKVACHPFIIGELACGNIANRVEIISLLQSLPMLEVIDHEEFLLFIENNQLMGVGLGFVDINLMAAAILAQIPIWTLDKKLAQSNIKLGINYKS